MTADEVHAQTHALRAQAAQQPAKIELGRSQRAAIEQAQREAAGFDPGPLLEFQGLPVVKSRRDDHIKLLATDEDGEDVEIEPVAVEQPSGPDAPPAAEDASA